MISAGKGLIELSLGEEDAELLLQGLELLLAALDREMGEHENELMRQAVEERRTRLHSLVARLTGPAAEVEAG